MKLLWKVNDTMKLLWKVNEFYECSNLIISCCCRCSDDAAFTSATSAMRRRRPTPTRTRSSSRGSTTTKGPSTFTLDSCRSELNRLKQVSGPKTEIIIYWGYSHTTYDLAQNKTGQNFRIDLQLRFQTNGNVSDLSHKTIYLSLKKFLIPRARAFNNFLVAISSWTLFLLHLKFI